VAEPELTRGGAGDDLEQVADCPGCGASRQTLRLEEPDALFPGGLLTLVECPECGLVYLNPRLTVAAIERLEDESDVYGYGDQELARQIEARRKLLRGIAEHASGRRRTMLDVGCNRGLLLEAARREGWRAAGVELSPVAAARARELSGRPVYGRLEDVPRPWRGFDLVVAWHVLEHTTDPLDVVARVHELLRRRSGVFAVQVPSFDHVDDFRADGRLGSIVCTVHNLYFTKDALEGLLRRAGFARVEIGNSPTDFMLTAFASRGG
jgi:SAM-dependent methyltransferase